MVIKKSNKNSYIYSPQYKWSKENYTMKKSLNSYLSQIIEKIIYTFPRLKIGYIDKNILEYRKNMSNVYSEPDNIELELISLITSWIIPVEKINKVKDTFYTLKDKYQSHPYGDFGDRDLLESAFNYTEKKIFHGGWSNLGGFDLRNTNYKYIERIERFNLNYDLSSYCILNAEIVITEQAKNIFNKIIEFEHKDFNRILFPWETKKGVGISLHTTPGNKVKLKEIENLILDIKWEANNFLLKHSDENNYINIEHIPGIEIYKYSGFNHENSESNNFWKSVGMRPNQYLDFITDDEKYHFFYSSFDRSPFEEGDDIDNNIKILADSSKIYKEEGYYTINSQIRHRAFNWGNYIALLINIDSLVNQIENKLSKIRNLIYLTIDDKSNSNKTSFDKIMSAKYKLFNLLVLLERLFNDYDQLHDNYISLNFPKAVYKTTSSTSSNEFVFELFSDVNNRITRRLSNLKDQFDIIDKLGKQKLEHQLVISNRYIALVGIIIAAISLIISFF